MPDEGLAKVARVGPEPAFRVTRPPRGRRDQERSFHEDFRREKRRQEEESEDPAEQADGRSETRPEAEAAADEPAGEACRRAPVDEDVVGPVGLHVDTEA
jgi:hypothetical protein